MLSAGGSPPARQRISRLKFIDEVCIRVRAGSGGRGCRCFHRTRSLPRGRPDGGDGGPGGAVVLVADRGVQSLAALAERHVFHAGNGAPGRSNNRAGVGGRDLELNVPPGTRVSDEFGMLGELLNSGERIRVAVGGRGGVGNGHGGAGGPGSRGEQRRLYLELRLFADVGLLGLPNAGKSSLLRAVSGAKPKVAEYPFTTLDPQLGYVEVEPGAGFILADIPGLISGAANGAGLGLKFLRHLERNRMLLHLVDAAAGPVEVLAGQVRLLEKELAEYGFPALPRKVVLNKVDLLAPGKAAALQAGLTHELGLSEPVALVSAQTGQGCPQLCRWVATQLAVEPVVESEALAHGH